MGAGPVVGIAGTTYDVARPWGSLTTHGVPRNYVDQVLAAGGRPVILPPRSTDLLDVVDAVVLAGGGDLDPALYGRPGAPAEGVDVDRDRAEIDLVRQAHRAGVPLLGVCRGAQVMVVAYGGTLIPDLGDHVLVEGQHPIRCDDGSVIAGLLGGRPRVNSLHHQAVDESGPSWRSTARADDGVIEAVEWDGGDAWQALGVQWHPELEHTGSALFGWLVRAAGERSPRGLDVIRSGCSGDQLV
jgi:putative glutamine amidotransferase